MIHIFKDSRNRSALVALFILVQIYAVRYEQNPYRDEIFHSFNALYFLLGFLSISRKQAVYNLVTSLVPVAGFLLAFLFLFDNNDIRHLPFHQRTEVSFKVWLFILISGFFSFFFGRIIRILVLIACRLVLKIRKGRSES